MEFFNASDTPWMISMGSCSSETLIISEMLLKTLDQKDETLGHKTKLWERIGSEVWHLSQAGDVFGYMLCILALE